MKKKNMKRNMMITLMAALWMAVGIETAQAVNFQFYGSSLDVRFGTGRRVSIKSCSGGELVRCLDWLDKATEESVEDCMRIKKEMNLSDWAYLQMIEQFSKAALGNTNEAVLLMCWVLDSSGYDVAICRYPARKLQMLFKSEENLPGLASYQFYEKTYYLWNSTTKSGIRNFDPLSSAGAPVSFKSMGGQRFAPNPTEPRTVTSQKNSDFSFTYTLNKNLIDFFATVPKVNASGNDADRYTIVANAPLEAQLQTTLVSDMKRKVAGMSQKDALQQLLWWVQTGFQYQEDDAVWGYDRALYAEETLFHPACDDEDRSILLSRLVRDVLGLDVVMLCYQGHTAIGVCVTDADVPGDYVVYEGMHYVICDPTYVGGNVGQEMPATAGREKTVAKLAR